MNIFDDPQYAEERNASTDLITRLTNLYIGQALPTSSKKAPSAPIVVRSPYMNLADVDYHMTILRNQFSYLREKGQNGFPAISLSGGTVIPVNIFNGTDFYMNNNLNVDLDISDAMKNFRADFNDRKKESLRYKKFENFAVNDIRDAMKRSLSAFLRFRLKGLMEISNSATMKKFLANAKVIAAQLNAPPYMQKGNTGASKYLTITVKTPQHHGLTIASTPNYIENWTYFGAPSHPVTGYLEPGRYRFRVDGTAVGGVRTHPLPIAIPPSFDIELTL
ncbi:hypothetical protein [Pedobacter chitinilyticus]|uniref:Uncharacterized protein n=1 Tax=Pedobacter chitinilyticus TaxID=2233776 RepID=A0A443Z015_9SPHI|nr:hypothetical protein [Pedobacter chitinilyticus]RWU09872.1 hypothetical protein DPV69_00560 [Pedobacter chitinilyticus]